MLVDKKHFRKIYYFQIFLLVITVCFISLSNAIILSDDKLFIEAVGYKENRIIVIDAGHGGEDSGAIGVNGAFEKDLNLEIANLLGKYFENAGYTVVYTRTEDKLLYKEEENIKGFRKIYDLKNRLKIAEQYTDSYLISIHMNSFGDAKYSGLQVYYSENNEKSQRLASSIQDNVRNKLQKENKRTIKKGKDIYLMENAKNPAVLIECGFLSNQEECDRLCEKEYQKELCFAIVCGIISFENSFTTDNQA